MDTIIKKPVISEKSIQQGKVNKYTFLIDHKATKPQVKDVISRLFKVEVISVRIVRLPGKPKTFRRIAGRRSVRKHAIVTLKQGDRIALFEEKK